MFLNARILLFKNDFKTGHDMSKTVPSLRIRLFFLLFLSLQERNKKKCLVKKKISVQVNVVFVDV